MLLMLFLIWMVSIYASLVCWKFIAEKIFVREFTLVETIQKISSMTVGWFLIAAIIICGPFATIGSFGSLITAWVGKNDER